MTASVGGAQAAEIAVALLLAGAVLVWPSRSARLPTDGPWNGHRVGLDVGTAQPGNDGQFLGGGRWGTSSQRHGIPPSPGAPAIADALELMALVLGAGGGLIDAVESVAQTSRGAVREHLAIVAAAVRWGMPWQVAWDAVGAGWAPARRAMALADAAGVAPSAALRGAAADLRAAQLEQLELAAARLGVTIVLPLGLAFLPAFVLLTVVPLVVALAGEVWA